MFDEIEAGSSTRNSMRCVGSDAREPRSPFVLAISYDMLATPTGLRIHGLYRPHCNTKYRQDNTFANISPLITVDVIVNK